MSSKIRLLSTPLTGQKFALGYMTLAAFNRSAVEEETGPPAGVIHLVRKILSHFVEHPSAKDTTEGIYTWWIGEGQHSARRDEVQKALDWLVSRGWVTTREAHPSQNIYGLCEQNFDQIKTFLNESEGK